MLKNCEVCLIHKVVAAHNRLCCFTIELCAILTPDMEQEYELVLVTKADIGDSDRNKVLDQVKKVIEATKGKIGSVDDWGKRELAYAIQKSSHGFYSVVNFSSDPKSPQNIQTKIKLMDDVLRFLIFKKEVEKSKKKKKEKKIKGG